MPFTPGRPLVQTAYDCDTTRNQGMVGIARTDIIVFTGSQLPERICGLGLPGKTKTLSEQNMKQRLFCLMELKRIKSSAYEPNSTYYRRDGMHLAGTPDRPFEGRDMEAIMK